MGRRSSTAAAVAFLLVAGLASPAASSDNGPDVSVVRVSGPSPFADVDCGPIDYTIVTDNQQTGREFDPTIAVNPTDPDNIVAAWIQDSGLAIVAAASFDGGQTWARTVVPGLTQCTGGESGRITHARLSFGPDGRLYLAGEGLDAWAPDPRAGNTTVPVVTSVDGGLTWSEPSFLHELPHGNGFETLAAEPDVPGAAVVAWHEREPLSASYVSRTTDGGRTWQRHDLPAYAVDALPLQRVLAAPDGALYVFYSEETIRSFAGWFLDVFFGVPVGGGTPLSVIRSDDKGLTWSEPVEVVADQLGEWVSAGVAPDGTITVAAWRSLPGDTFGLFVTRSTDRGATWSEPSDVAVVQSTFPVLAVGTDGSLGVVATVPSDTPGTSEVAFFHSADGGGTWTRTPVDGPSPAMPYARPGFYQETVATPTGFAAVYVRRGPDVDGETDVFVARVRTGSLDG